ncbi:MAG: GGDEF domain-containing protein [Betaproteobacteria bacterium HGW-Betaproteobacteria-13]|jgi:diguanylate cyclase (GGDEF)-like protein|nr:MAG: GGDEF domain-containing protein [Betaproteobacteria bacterium HGW-Betaproteobacteria-13]
MRFGIAARLALLLALVGMLAAGLTGFYAHNASRDLLIQSAKDELLTSTQVLASRIIVARQEISRNLKVLSTHPSALGALDPNDTESADQLATLFKLLMKANPDYFQIRLISAADFGAERVRIDRSGDSLLRIDGDDLQEKGHYAYVFESLKGGPGETYLSRFVINHERGSHAGQEEPTAQLAMPVVDAGKVALGVIVINVDLNGVFAQLAAGLPPEFQLFLANGQGDFLIHPDRSQTFGFDRGRRILVQDTFALTADLVAGKSDHVLIEATQGNYADYPMVAAFIQQGVAIRSDERNLILGLAQPLASVLHKADALGVVILQIVLGLCLVCALLAVLVARAVTRPINLMSAAVQGFSDERQAHGLPLEREDEIGVLARSFKQLRDQIRQQLSELHQSRQDLEHLAQHDPLTGLPNRALFADRMALALAAVRRDQTRLALMFIDLDDFKPVNDAHGHAVGDQLLKEIGARLRKSIRESDTAARIGGDEFVVLLRNIQSAEDAMAVGEKIRIAVGAPFIINHASISISASIGIALCPESGQDLIELSKNADNAMYRAKKEGRNTVIIHTASAPT